VELSVPADLVILAGAISCVEDGVVKTVQAGTSGVIVLVAERADLGTLTILEESTGRACTITTNRDAYSILKHVVARTGARETVTV
jgi:hypothetical protein